MITQATIEQATRDCVAKANAMFGTSFILTAIRWYPNGLRIGCFCPKDDSIKYNADALRVKPEHLLKVTVPHEVAHAIVRYMRRHGMFVVGKSHGKTWKRVCLALGGIPKACTWEGEAPERARAYAPRRRTRYVYVLNSGREVELGPKHHKALQSSAFAILRLRDTGERIFGMMWKGRRTLPPRS